MKRMRTDLPIEELAGAVCAGLRQYRRMVVQAPTGSGKSTRIPQILLEENAGGPGEIVILQPRRLAARLLALRVAEEMGVKPGDEVGYQVRFENVTSARTRISFITEGILLRRLIADPDLRGISTLILDEFHERHLYGDLSLACALKLQQTRRPDLNIVVMSATLAKDDLITYLNPCAVIESQGRQFEVSEEYLDRPLHPQAKIWDEAAQACETAARGRDGDVLIFMPGAYEIQRTMESLRGMLAARDWEICALHGELPPERQNEALRASDRRKVIVATNVAETSITIPTVKIVVDGGLARVNRFDPRRGINTLMVEKISRASAEQRKGRAGRVAAGHCVRLWTATEHAQRAVAETPEIRRIDLSEIILLLKGVGLGDFAAFPWFEAPEPASLQRAVLLLENLGAFQEGTGVLTEIGRQMLRYPVHPRYARMLWEGEKRGCYAQACVVAALAQGKSVLRRNVSKQTDELRADVLGGEESSDFFLHMRAWKYAEGRQFEMRACDKLGIDVQSARQVGKLVQLFQSYGGKSKDSQPLEARASSEAIRRCLLAGFADHVARRLDQGSLRCELVQGRRGDLARESVVRNSPLLVVAEISEIQRGSGDVVTLLNLATAIEEGWLAEVAEGSVRESRQALFDPGQRRVMTQVAVMYHDLLLKRRLVDQADPSEAAVLLAEEVMSGHLVLKGWDDEVEKWLLRVNFLAREAAELGFHTFGEGDKRMVLEQFCLGSVSYKDIKEKPVLPFLKDWMSRELLGAMEALAPERMQVGGKKLKISYAANEPPSLSATIQELYDLQDTPKILGGKFPLLVKIQAPSRRPVQITQDMAGFWREAYPKIKPELQRRYPKHEWR